MIHTHAKDEGERSLESGVFFYPEFTVVTNGRIDRPTNQQNKHGTPPVTIVLTV